MKSPIQRYQIIINQLMKIEKLFIRIGGKNSEKTNVTFIIFIYIHTDFFPSIKEKFS